MYIMYQMIFLFVQDRFINIRINSREITARTIADVFFCVQFFFYWQTVLLKDGTWEKDEKFFL